VGLHLLPALSGDLGSNFYYYSGRAICVYRAIHAGSLFFIRYDNRARHLQKGG
jgi:hypothetical protein